MSEVLKKLLDLSSRLYSKTLYKWTDSNGSEVAIQVIALLRQSLTLGTCTISLNLNQTGHIDIEK